MTTIDHPIVLFDGVCNLCNGAVQFIVKRDPAGVIRFASLQSSYARQRLQELGLDPDRLFSIIVISEGKARIQSDAVFEIARYLGAPWKYLRVFRIIPRPVRDGVYTFIANNRYRWFGKQDQCMVPTPALKARFVA
jgi:predicted DCC family thiol-disulfide oxidoreductase YuxK